MTQPRPTVLIVDDDEGTRDTLELCLKRDCRVLQAMDGETALKLVAGQEIAIVLLDIRLPGIDGMEVLKRIKEHSGEIEVVMVSWVQDLETAVTAMKLGAYDYIPKEFDYDRVRNLVLRILEKQTQSHRIAYLEDEVDSTLQDDFLMGRTPKMQAILETVGKIAPLPITVLLTGESGTGKERLARLIHRKRGDPGLPFVAVNLPAIPAELLESTLFGHEKGAFTGASARHPGKFELADGGTLFLDEIGDLQLDLQGKLLRAIQEGEIERVGGSKAISIDARLIAATNQDLKEKVRQGKFREDLYWRLNVLPLELPPLRERREDIPGLSRLFLKRYNRKFGKRIAHFSRTALGVLEKYDWPGNIRELENLVGRLVATVDGPAILEGHLPIEYYFCGSDWREPRPDFFREACETFERNFLLKAMEKTAWNCAKAARMLSLPPSTLRYKLKTLGLSEVVDRQKLRSAGKSPKKDS